MFCREDGVVLHPWSVSGRFRTLARQSGLPPPVLSRRLGHARVEITLGIYGHLLPGGDQSAAGTVADRILGASPDLDKRPSPQDGDGPPDEEAEHV